MTTTFESFFLLHSSKESVITAIPTTSECIIHWCALVRANTQTGAEEQDYDINPYN